MEGILTPTATFTRQVDPVYSHCIHRHIYLSILDCVTFETHFHRHLFQGMFRDKRVGQGYCTFADGSRYTGEWANSKQHGHGRMDYPNGDIWIGEWRNDRRAGRGIFRTADGNQWEGDWLQKASGDCVFVDFEGFSLLGKIDEPMEKWVKAGSSNTGPEKHGSFDLSTASTFSVVCVRGDTDSIQENDYGVGGGVTIRSGADVTISIASAAESETGMLSGGHSAVIGVVGASRGANRESDEVTGIGDATAAVPLPLL